MTHPASAQQFLGNDRSACSSHLKEPFGDGCPLQKLGYSDWLIDARMEPGAGLPAWQVGATQGIIGK